MLRHCVRKEQQFLYMMIGSRFSFVESKMTVEKYSHLSGLDDCAAHFMATQRPHLQHALKVRNLGVRASPIVRAAVKASRAFDRIVPTVGVRARLVHDAERAGADDAVTVEISREKVVDAVGAAAGVLRDADGCARTRRRAQTSAHAHRGARVGQSERSGETTLTSRHSVEAIGAVGIGTAGRGRVI